ncbi:hypothetical protein HZS_5393 [Henneguya salminicola]|nr:hypothetical protein HZS_5393 [Henneguya salminicola]
MFSPGMNPQAMFQSFTPNISLPFVVQDNPPNPSKQLHHDKEVVQPRREHMETSPRHSSRSKDKRDDIRKREIRKHRDKRSRSKDRNYKVAS